MAFIHHTNKEGKIHGSGFLTNKARAVFTVETETSCEEREDEEERKILKVTLTKANEVKTPQEWIFDFDSKGALWPG